MKIEGEKEDPEERGTYLRQNMLFCALNNEQKCACTSQFENFMMSLCNVVQLLLFLSKWNQQSHLWGFLKEKFIFATCRRFKTNLCEQMGSRILLRGPTFDQDFYFNTYIMVLMPTGQIFLAQTFEFHALWAAKLGWSLWLYSKRHS